MAKPKLPKPKVPFKQRIRDETRKAAVQGLHKNFGVLGKAIAKRYLPTPPRAASKGVDPKQASTKKIPNKKIAQNSAASEAVLQSANSVATGIDTVTTNISRALMTTNHQAEIMGTEVTRSLNELNAILDRMLYQKKQGQEQQMVMPKRIPHRKSDDDDDGWGWPWRKGRGIRPQKPRSRARRAKALARLRRIKGISPFGIKRFLPSIKIPLLSSILEGYESYSEVQSGESSVGRSIAGFVGGVGGTVAGSALGAGLGSPGGPIGSFAGLIVGGSLGAKFGRSSLEDFYDRHFGGNKSSSTSGDGKVKIGGDEHVIHRLKYSAEKIDFKASDFIEFRSKTATTENSTITPQSSGGILNNFFDKMKGGPGGAGFFNNLADKIFGTGPQGAGGGGAGGKGSGSAGNKSGGGSDQPNVSTNGKEVPPEVLEKAEALLRGGASSNDLQNFMSSQGYPMRGNWCGEFMASVVKSVGNTPPKNPAIASNWRNYGQSVDPKDIKPGDIAVRKNNKYGVPVPTGSTGSHVGAVKSIKGGRFTILGGNQGSPTHSADIDQYEFRRAVPKEGPTGKPVEPPKTTTSSPQASSPSSTSLTDKFDEDKWKQKDDSWWENKKADDPNQNRKLQQDKDIELRKSDQQSLLEDLEPVNLTATTRRSQMADASDNERRQQWWGGRGSSTASMMNMNNDDLDHRPRQVAAKGQDFREYTSTENGMEDLV